MAEGGRRLDAEFQTLVEEPGTCAVCLEIVRDHRGLPCHHVFCLECLKPLVRGNEITCPTCLDESKLKKGVVEGLPNNLLLTDILQKLCVACRRNFHAVECDRCHRWLCKNCYEPCRKAIDIADVLACSAAFASKQSHFTEEVRHERNVYRKRMNTTIEQIRCHTRELVQRLKEEETKLLEELESESCAIEERFCHRMSKADDMKSKVQIHTQKLRTPRTTCMEVVTVFNNITNIHEDKLWKEPASVRYTTFIPDNVPIIKSKTSIGILSSEASTRQPSIHDSEVVVERTTDDQSTVTILGAQGSGPGQLHHPSYVTVSPLTGHIVVADSGNHRIHVFDPLGRYSHMFGQEGHEDGEFMLDIWSGVATTLDGEIVVSDTNNHRIQVFTEHGKFIASLGSLGSDPGEFYYPRGISYKDCHVYIADYGNGRIQVLELDGSFKRMIPLSNMNPWDISVCPDGVLVVSQGGLPGELRVYSGDGTHQVTLGNGDASSLKLVCPFGVAVDQYGQMMVTDAYTHKIHVLDQSGDVVDVLGCHGDKPGQVTAPTGIACTLADDIVVVDQNNHRIQIFSFQ